MKRWVVVEKEVGETPRMALEAFKRSHPEYQGVPATYAGRLDPMASGKLLILVGDECKKQAKYHGLDKEYEIEVLLDVGSDTGDALGLVVYANKETGVHQRAATAALTKELGKHTHEYPPFSSKTVNGKPLFLYALEGALDTIDVPHHHEHIYAISLLEIKQLTTASLETHIGEFLSKVPKTDELSKALGANFRIDAVRHSWGTLFRQSSERDFAVLRLRVICGAGTYMRSLAGRIGESLGTKALALSIRRTRIGKRIAGFWYKEYQ